LCKISRTNPHAEMRRMCVRVVPLGEVRLSRSTSPQATPARRGSMWPLRAGPGPLLRSALCLRTTDVSSSHWIRLITSLIAVSDALRRMEPSVNLRLCDHLGYLVEKRSPARVITNCPCRLKPGSLPTAFTTAEARDHLGLTLMVAGVSLASSAFSGRAGQWDWLRSRWCLPC